MSLSKEIQLFPRAAAAPRLYYPFIPAAAAAGAARAQRARWPVTWPVRAHGTARAAPPVRGEREDGLRGWPGVRGRDSRRPSSRWCTR